MHLGQREVVGQGHAFLTQQLLLLLRQLEVWVELQHQEKSQLPTNEREACSRRVSPGRCGGWAGPAGAAH